MVAGGRQCALQIFTDISKEGAQTTRVEWSIPESKLHINFLELKAVFMAQKSKTSA